MAGGVQEPVAIRRPGARRLGAGDGARALLAGAAAGGRPADGAAGRGGGWRRGVGVEACAGAGRWSTDRWPVGAVVRDEYRVGWPEWAGPGRYRVEVGVRPYDGELLAPERAGKTVAAPDNLVLFLGWLEKD